MRRLVIPVLALTLAGAPAVLEAQATPRGDRAQFAARGSMGNPAARVLQHRQALDLTAEQVRQLEALQAQHAARVQPLHERVREARGEAGVRRIPSAEQKAELRQRRAAMTPEQREQLREQGKQRRGAMTPEQREHLRERLQGARQANPEARARMEAMRPVLQELRQHQQQARGEVRDVLTARQVAALQELSPRRGDAARLRGEGTRRGAGGRR
jgi:Spy/CpxP family protein refolding chaperone